MRTDEEIYKDIFNWVYLDDKLTTRDKYTIRASVKRCINEGKKEALKEVHEIIATMDWDVMSNTIDAKELQSKLNSLIKELK